MITDERKLESGSIAPWGFFFSFFLTFHPCQSMTFLDSLVSPLSFYHFSRGLGGRGVQDRGSEC